MNPFLDPIADGKKGNYVRLKEIPPSLVKAGVLFYSPKFPHNIVKNSISNFEASW